MPRLPSRSNAVVSPARAAAPRRAKALAPIRALWRGRPSQTTYQEVQALQRSAGNAAVSAELSVQRAPTATATHPVLQIGSHGEAVKEAQRKLSFVHASAAPLTEDGQFGSRTAAAVRTFQGSNAIPGSGAVDAATWTALDAGAAALPAPARAVLTPGMDHPDVGIAQQKLNAIGATPRLVVDAVYGATMNAPVAVLEMLLVHRLPTGIIDAPVWTALDTAVAGGGTVLEGANNTPVEQGVDSGTPDSRGTQNPGTSLHPVVGAGGLTSGAAVRELQQKLNTAGASPALKVDGAFGPLTGAAVTAFQTSRTPPLAGSGVADVATWTALDAVAPGSTVGAISRVWTEEVGGHIYGLSSQYSWEVLPDRMLVTVKVNFTGLAPAPSWFGFVPAVWNQYAAVRDDVPPKTMPIDFQMVRGSGADAMTIKVSPGTGRANAGEWFIGDTDARNTVPHEFGHLIGLRDEYQQHAGDYVAATGHEPPVGQTTGPAGQTPLQVAQALQAAMLARNDVAARAAVAGIASGAWAQRVVAAYATLPTVTVPATAGSAGPPVVAPLPAVVLSGTIDRDLDKTLPATTDMYETIQVLTYSSGSIMGDPSRAPDPHDHGSQPRHIAEFTALLGTALGGTWRTASR